MIPEQIRPIAAFLRNMLEGRPNSNEEWEAMWKFLEDETVIARRLDWKYRTHEFFPELKRWLWGQRENFLQLTDEQQVNVTGSHFYWWLKARPYPPSICYEDQLGQDRETGEQRKIEEVAEAPEEKENLEDIEAPESPPRGRPKKKI
jgi:hypothetical protein